MKTKTSEQPLSYQETASFCSQMAMILRSGISPAEGISIMVQDASSEAERRLLAIVEETLQATGSLTNALKATGAFPSYLLQMTEIGEQSGKLDEVMDALAEYYDREDSIADSMKQAVTYPLVMLAMMAVVVVLLITKVLPVFQQVFEQLGRKMNGFSSGLLAVGETMNRYSSVFLILLILAVLCVFFCVRTASGKKAAAKIAARLGIGKEFRRKTAACRFAGGMALTLSSGLDVDRSFELSAELVEDEDFRKKIQACRQSVQEGTDFAAALSEAGILTGLYARMIHIGSRTGCADEMFQKIALQTEEELDGHIRRRIAVLEPTLVAILSVIVGVILLSVMLPLMGILSGM